MDEEGRFGLAEAELKAAFRQEGCPICRLRREAERRYLFHLLWENVNDLSTRTRLVHSSGFCATHTWELLHMELQQFGDALGNGILYEDLLWRVAGALRELALRLHRQKPSRRRRRWWPWRRQGAPLAWPVGLAPGASCPVCAQGAEAERRTAGWLVQGCADEDFRAAYANSQGLCLTHLRQALAEAARTSPEMAAYLAEDAAMRLAALQQDLGEYLRKRAWQHRHEAITTEEARAPRRAAGFFGGLDPLQGKPEGAAPPAGGAQDDDGDPV